MDSHSLLPVISHLFKSICLACDQCAYSGEVPYPKMSPLAVSQCLDPLLLIRLTLSLKAELHPAERRFVEERLGSGQLLGFRWLCMVPSPVRGALAFLPGL